VDVERKGGEEREKSDGQENKESLEGRKEVSKDEMEGEVRQRRFG